MKNITIIYRLYTSENRTIEVEQYAFADLTPKKARDIQSFLNYNDDKNIKYLFTRMCLVGDFMTATYDLTTLKGRKELTREIGAKDNYSCKIKEFKEVLRKCPFSKNFYTEVASGCYKLLKDNQEKIDQVNEMVKEVRKIRKIEKVKYEKNVKTMSKSFYECTLVVPLVTKNQKAVKLLRLIITKITIFS